MISILKQLQIIAVLLKGGPGSGNFGHAGIPGQVGGSASSGGSSPEMRRAFEERTAPLSRRAKFDDEVVFLDSNDNPVFGQIAAPKNSNGELGIQTKDGLKYIPEKDLRMPKGGFRTRGE